MQWVFDGQPERSSASACRCWRIFPLISMFLVTSITMLRERTTGTLERLMTMPLAKLDLLLGLRRSPSALVAIGAGAVVVSPSRFGLLGLDTAGPVWAWSLLAIANALLGTAFGPVRERVRLDRVPGRAVPARVPAPPAAALRPARRRATRWRRCSSAISWFLPMTYAYDALTRVAEDMGGARLWADVAVLVASTALALAGGAATLRRRTACARG